jgi:DNA-binding SARP family transcriptional activator
MVYYRRKRDEKKYSEGLAICDYVLNIDDMYEPAIQARITLLKLLGRNSEAIRSYKLFQQRMAKSYSINPSKETHKLIADILACSG